MEQRWEGKNVNLGLLVSHICSFLKHKDFEIIKGETQKGYQILAGDSPNFELIGYVDIAIEGKPNDFTIRLSLGGGEKKKTKISPFLSSMFGGGYFYLQQLRSNEAWMNLKKELQRYLHDILLRLTNSAKLSH